MPFDLHQQLGPLMQKLRAGFSWRVGQKLSSTRSQLEDWSIAEHQHLHKDAVYDLYNGDPSTPICNTDTERLEALTAALAIVERGYDNCKPRRDLIAALDAAISEMQKRQNA